MEKSKNFKHGKQQHGFKDLEQKSKQLDRACQKLESDLHKKNVDYKALHKDCQDICKISEECENCCKKLH